MSDEPFRGILHTRPVKPGWYIYDSATKRPYINKAYSSQSIAEGEREELLRGYPLKNEWHARLHVKHVEHVED